MLLITVASLLPPSTMAPAVRFFLLSDKVLHGGAYMVAAFFMMSALAREEKSRSFRNLVRVNTLQISLTFTSVVALGAVLEVIQPYVQRAMEWLDLVADAVGAMMGIMFALGVAGIVTRRNPDA